MKKFQTCYLSIFETIKLEPLKVQMFDRKKHTSASATDQLGLSGVTKQFFCGFLLIVIRGPTSLLCYIILRILKQPTNCKHDFQL